MLNTSVNACYEFPCDDQMELILFLLFSIGFCYTSRKIAGVCVAAVGNAQQTQPLNYKMVHHMGNISWEKVESVLGMRAPSSQLCCSLSSTADDNHSHQLLDKNATRIGKLGRSVSLHSQLEGSNPWIGQNNHNTQEVKHCMVALQPSPTVDWVWWVSWQ